MHGEKGNTIELSLVALERDIQTKAQPRAMAVEWKKEGEGRVTERDDWFGHHWPAWLCLLTVAALVASSK